MIYLIQCMRCDLQYVGELGQPLHLDITHQEIAKSHVVAHFNSMGHSVVDMLVMVINKTKNDTILRKNSVGRSIRMLDTS